MQTFNGNLSKQSKQLPTAHCSLPTEYVELHSRSAFSFLKGASTPEEIIAACAKLGMPAMALLDRDGLYGAPRFHLAAEKTWCQSAYRCGDFSALRFARPSAIIHSPATCPQSHWLSEPLLA